jgi:hypothetical protein
MGGGFEGLLKGGKQSLVNVIENAGHLIVFLPFKPIEHN